MFHCCFYLKKKLGKSHLHYANKINTDYIDASLGILAFCSGAGQGEAEEWSRSSVDVVAKTKCMAGWWAIGYPISLIYVVS